MAVNKFKYYSDLHLGHANIVRYTRRPFRDREHMDLTLIANLREAEKEGGILINGGDTSFNLKQQLNRYGPIFESNVGKWKVSGNHDRIDKYRAAYEQTFDVIVGDEDDWKTNTLIVEDVLDGNLVKVLVSHRAQENLQGCAVNVYGHVHNSMLLRFVDKDDHHPEDFWAFSSPAHFCACVELHHFRPVDLQTLADRHRIFYGNALVDITPSILFEEEPISEELWIREYPKKDSMVLKWLR